MELQRPFDPTNSGKEKLPFGSRHYAYSLKTEYTSKPQSLLTYGISTRAGGYYAGGKLYSLGTDFGYRFQPYVSLAVSTAFNQIDLPLPWGRTNYWLVSSQ